MSAAIDLEGQGMCPRLSVREDSVQWGVFEMMCYSKIENFPIYSRFTWNVILRVGTLSVPVYTLWYLTLGMFNGSYIVNQNTTQRTLLMTNNLTE